ncbi:MAG: potassium-transporting ATPase subunit KdpC [Caldilineaceae bacterium]|nr:potassium-transporting ATPase subunit KdpC [Caldilineaceae bacterium]
MNALLRPALTLLVTLTLLAGGIYPLVVTGLAQAIFPAQANGSLMREGDQVIGSSLIGQPFAAPETFWGRLSATVPHPYNAAASLGSNLAPTSADLLAAAQERITALHAADPTNDAPIPVDLVTASASGLDPHISVAAALYQLPRVAQARGVDAAQIRSLIDAATEERQFGILGEPRVNVLKLNLMLEGGDW